MIRSSSIGLLFASLLSLSAAAAEPLSPDEVFDVWPGGNAPGDNRDIGEEHILEGRPRPFYQITNVSHPTVSVFVPPAEQRTGAAMLVLPGGGLQRLAIEHEGYEVSAWLRSLNITVFMLKYRVPAPVEMGLQDAQRAMNLIRSRAGEWGIDPNGIGIIGFSAGAEIATWLATHYDELHYDRIDDADDQSSRPDFATLIYPGGLLQRDPWGLKNAIAERLDARATPPMFITHAFDDFAQNSLYMALGLKRARVPTEVHLFQEGGHGFGARETGHPVNNWRERYIDWMNSWGYLDAARVRDYEKAFTAALTTDGQLPRLSSDHPSATLTDAYAIQRRHVRRQSAHDEVAGFKGAVVSTAAQSALGIERPLTGVLFGSGELAAADTTSIPLPTDSGMAIETEIGYRVAVDIGYHVLTAAQARDAVEWIAPVVELPVSYGDRIGPLDAVDMAAINIGSDRFLVGETRMPTEINPDELTISLHRDDTLLHETTGANAHVGQWENLRLIINQIVDQGHTIKRGSIIISGALGAVQPGMAGRYRADYGPLGVIEFSIQP